jgi:hypothetical protein
MKQLIFFISILIGQAFAYEFSCRNLEDFRMKITVIETGKGPVLRASMDDYGSGDSARDSFIASRTVSWNETRYSAWGIEFKLLFNEGPEIDYRKVDGDMDELFLGVLVKGLRREFHGEYACVENKSMGLTIQGDEPDGGYSITL